MLFSFVKDPTTEAEAVALPTLSSKLRVRPTFIASENLILGFLVTLENNVPPSESFLSNVLPFSGQAEKGRKTMVSIRPLSAPASDSQEQPSIR